MKTLKTLQQDYDGYKPKAGDEQKFKATHVVKHSHNLSKPTEDDDMFKATNVKVASRDPGHGYNAGEDEEVYEEAEQVEEKITAKDVKMAIGVAKDKRYAGGNMTGASRVMDKIKSGLSKHPAAQKALRQANEGFGDRGTSATELARQTAETEKGKQDQNSKKAEAAQNLKKYQDGKVRANYRKEETEQVDEGNMPRNVIAAKERIKSMTPREFYQEHQGKSASDLQSMAWRHGYGKNNDVYVKKHKEGQQESVAKEAEPAAKKSLGEMMEAMENKEPVGVELHFTSNDPEQKPFRVTHFTAKNARDEEERAPKGYKVKRRLVYGKEST